MDILINYYYSLIKNTHPCWAYTYSCKNYVIKVLAMVGRLDTK